MRRIPQYVNPRIQLRTPPLMPVTIEEYRAHRRQLLDFIAMLMGDLMVITQNQPRKDYSRYPSTRIAVENVRHNIAQRQTELANLRKRLAAG